MIDPGASLQRRCSRQTLEMVERRFFYATDGKKVQCQVSPNVVFLHPGDRSVCRSKVNIGGSSTLWPMGTPVLSTWIPLKRNPFTISTPKSRIFSIATTGCSFRCLNCQNWEISQRKPEEVEHMELFPDQVVTEVKKRGLPSIAYTYSEPITYYEYMVDTAKTR